VRGLHQARLTPVRKPTIAPMEGGVADMGKGWVKWIGGVVAAAFANCLANHVVDCVFERIGLSCPRGGSA
jgi:hypothetical protein